MPTRSPRRRSVPSLLILLAVSCAAPGVSLVSDGLSGAPALPSVPTPAPEEHDWNRRLIDPVTQPYWFESPIISSQVRPIHIRHDFPGSSVVGGGKLRAYALQLRYAVTPRLALIAVKDGHIDFEPGGLPHDSGNTDIAGGFKFMVFEDPDSGQLVTVGLVYECDNGDTEVFQGNGSGVWRPFVTGGWDLGAVNLTTLVGANLARDGKAESDSVDYHLHVSYEATPGFWPLIEINGVHYTDDGEAFPTHQELLDYGNLGSTMVEDHDVITGAAGFRWRLSETLDFGFAWEWPLSTREDIFEDRVTLDLIKRF